MQLHRVVYPALPNGYAVMFCGVVIGTLAIGRLVIGDSPSLRALLRAILRFALFSARMLRKEIFTGKQQKTYTRLFILLL